MKPAMKIEEDPDSKIHRLLNRKFSGDVDKMFNALKGQLDKGATGSSSFGLGSGSVPASVTKAVTKATYLRAFLKGIRLLKEQVAKGTNLSNYENLYNFRGSRGCDSRVTSQSQENKTSRLPLPSIKSVQRHLSLVIDNDLKTIRSRHLRILKLDLLGVYSRTEIAEMIGCSEPTVTNVLKSPAIQEFKQRAQAGMEDEYSSLLNPAIAAIRDSLKEGRPIELRQDTAFKYLKSQGKGVSSSINIHKHEHEVTGRDGGPIQVSEIKQRLLKKVGISPKDVIDGEFKEIGEIKEIKEEAGD